LRSNPRSGNSSAPGHSGDAIATRRHIDVVAESLRDDIRAIAERLIALDAKVETIRDSG
jgi:hypothetical protein